MRVLDLVGKRFGRLVPIKRVPFGNGNRKTWLCQCDCGKLVKVHAGTLTAGDTKSCGCWLIFQAKIRMIERNTTHGMSGSISYEPWKAMKQRCLNPNNPNYKDYGGSGISLCKRWFKFENFINDMGERPSLEFSIDRRNNSKGYCKSNCRWATPSQQQSNKRSNVMVTVDGVTKVLSRWCQEKGLNYQTIQGRIRDRNWEHKRAIFEPIKQKGKK